MFKILMKIEEQKDLFSPFDSDGDSLSDEVKAYIIGKMMERNSDDEIELQIISKQSVSEERVYRAFHKWGDEETRKYKVEYRKNIFQQMKMFTIGVCFIALSLALEKKVGVVWYTALSTIGAFSMWEAASIWIIQNPKLRFRKKAVGKLMDRVKLRIESMSL